ncbi:MAG: CpsD/CapB family tyrosine-protein kinase [Bacillota bacterium]
MAKETNGEKLVTSLNPRSPVSESYRELRTNLQFLTVDKTLRSIVVTSASPREGKTLTVANLAITMAQAGKKVIAVDSDLRRPTLCQIFGVHERQGLTSVISGGSQLDQVLVTTRTRGLRLLPSGPMPPNPAELLASERMKSIMAALEEQADVVIFDCPPVGAVTDAAVLASECDGVLLVVGAGKVSYKQAQRAKELLANVKANLLGVVLDGAGAERDKGYYYYYYGGDGDRKRRKRG